MGEKITIQFNDKPLEVEKGARLIEVCSQQAIEVPRFCYHAGLSVVGSCRMCQVEVAGPGPAPRRLAISCRTECVPGLQVWTDTNASHGARKGVLEFLLKNHPLDCPICDKAGECPLQNFTYAEGQSSGRSEDPRKHFRKKVDLGPVILLDEERCVLCTRCVRFTDEVAKDPQLFVRGRGPNAMVGTFEDEALKGNYQGNLADICPVGALTLKKFRFKARVWNMKSAVSVCPQCDRGCNITLETHRSNVVRIRPRYNEQVNKHWMCDIGRFGFDYLNDKARLNAVLIWKGDEFVDNGWDAGLAAAAKMLDAAGEKLIVIASPFLTNEEGRELSAVCKTLGASAKVLVPESAPADHLLYTGQKGPNVRGLKDLGFTELPAKDAATAITKSEVSYLAGELIWNLLGTDAQNAVNSAKSVIFQDIKLIESPGIDAYIPAATWAEKSGSFTNRDGLVQQFAPGMKLPRGVRRDLDTFKDLHKILESSIQIGVEVKE